MNILDIINGIAKSGALDWATITALAISIISLVISVFLFTRERYDASAYHIRERWDDLINICSENPQFLDPHFTENFTQAKEELQLRYDAFNYKAWSLVDYIVSRGLERDPHLSLLVQWVAAHHRPWLYRHPFLFNGKGFWQAIDAVENEPLTLFRSKPVPNHDQDTEVNVYEENLDWDTISEDYDEHILGPFAASMVQPDPKTGHMRNCLLRELSKIPPSTLRSWRIADYGCGPGNLLPNIANMIEEIYGIDFSQAALDIAAKRAAQLGITFHPVRADMTEYVPDEKYDLILSVNSILPPTRDDVPLMLKAIRAGLAPDGTFMAVMPSFDTTLRLRQYWQEHYTKTTRSTAHVEKCLAAFDLEKKINFETLQFADDGVHVQSFHTPDSIKRDFANAGLAIVGDLEKVYYPWELTRQFDYGYFPGKEEIWDWFVIARPAE